MIWNCGTCGTEIEEGTKFCPNCGTKINWETSQTEQSFTCGNCGGEFIGKVDYCPHCGIKINWNKKSLDLSVWQWIILSITALVSFFCLLAAHEIFIFISILSAIALILSVGILLLAYNSPSQFEISKKNLNRVIIVSCALTLLSVLLLNSPLKYGDFSFMQNSKQGSLEKTKDESVYAIYKVTDKVGSTITITLNEDETATLNIDGKAYYCSWYRPAVLKNSIEIDISGNYPYIAFDEGAAMVCSLYIKDGWLYQNFASAEAKNPKMRLKIN